MGTEIQQLHGEIDRIANGTTFNGQSLLTGSLSGTLGGASGTDLVVADAVGAATVTGINVSSAKADTYTFTNPGGVNTITLGNSAGQLQTVAIGALAAFGVETLNFNQLGVSVSLQSTAGETTANMITSLLTAANDTIVVTGSGAAAIQVGANTTANDSLNITFADVRANSGLSLGAAITPNAIVASKTAANTFINLIDTAITTLNTTRANLGASANRLEHTVASLGVSVENLTASESRVRDADIAQLSSHMASFQILQQAGTAVLAQANQSSQSVLKLLQ
jgi:flagellin